MKLKQQVIKHYNRLYSQKQAESISLLNHWTRQKELNNILKLVNPKDVVLDLGCGDGTVALMIAKKVKKVIGVDISREAIRRGKKNQKRIKTNNCSFIQTDINDLRLSNHSTDFILCLGIFEYFTDLDRQIKKIIKFLKSGGRLYFHVWNQESLVFKLKKAFGVLDKNKPFKRSFFKLKEIETIIKNNQLILINSYGQLIAHKLRVSNKKIFEILENLGKNRFLARFLADSLVFVINKPEGSD